MSEDWIRVFERAALSVVHETAKVEIEYVLNPGRDRRDPLDAIGDFLKACVVKWFDRCVIVPKLAP